MAETRRLYLVKYEMVIPVYGTDPEDAIMESFDHCFDVLPHATISPTLITSPDQLTPQLASKVPYNARNEKTCGQVAQKIKDDAEKDQLRLF